MPFHDAQYWVGDNDMKDRILRRASVRESTGLPNTTLDRLEAEGRFPKRRRITERNVGWSELEVQNWVDARLNGEAA